MIMEKTNNTRQDQIRDMVRKMVADKKAISNYIREHGTLKGFNDPTITFAKPL